MYSATAIIAVASIMQAYAQVSHADFENTMLGKPSRISMPVSSVSLASTPAAPHSRFHSGLAAVPAQVGSRTKPWHPSSRDLLHRRQYPSSITYSKTSGVKEEQDREQLTSALLRQEKESGFKWGNFWKKFDDEVWDAFQGRKEQRWSPDRRPEGQRGAAGPGEESKLAWGGAKSKEEYEEMCEKQQFALADKAEKLMASEPLGNAAVALQGESAKGDDYAKPKAESQKGFEDLVIEAQVPEGEARTISGAVEFAEMIHGKFGRYHDVAVLRNVGQVGFNTYFPSLGQRKFSYTEEQYLDKLDSILTMLNELDQAWFVRNFLLSPKAPRMGLPSSPRADTAVTLRLNLSPTWDDERNQEIVDAWLALRR